LSPLVIIIINIFDLVSSDFLKIFFKANKGLSSRGWADQGVIPRRTLIACYGMGFRKKGSD
jgi:hypothetical protein